MNLITLIIQMVLTIPLTIILNFLKNKENRRLNQILIPSIYIIIIAALLPMVKENIYLIVIFEIFIRNFYITNITNQDVEVSNTMFIFESLISIALSLFTYNYFIGAVETVIPSPEDIKPFIWFLMILYIASLYRLSIKNKVEKEKAKTTTRKKEQIIMQYAKYKNMYSPYIKSKNTIINNLTYAIMIHNNYQTPKFYRNINAYIGTVTKKETEYGIMKIKSYNRISDEESIKITINNFEKILKNTKLKESEQIDKLLKDYKLENQQDIISIYNDIIEFEKK